MLILLWECRGGGGAFVAVFLRGVFVDVLRKSCREALEECCIEVLTKSAVEEKSVVQEC